MKNILLKILLIVAVMINCCQFAHAIPVLNKQTSTINSLACYQNLNAKTLNLLIKTEDTTDNNLVKVLDAALIYHKPPLNINYTTKNIYFSYNKTINNITLSTIFQPPRLS